MTAFKRGKWYLLNRPDRRDEWVIILKSGVPTRRDNVEGKVTDCLPVYGLPITHVGVVGRVMGWVDVADLTTPITKEVARIMWSSNHVNDE